METIRDHETYQSALEAFGATSHSYAGGLSNHGPMAVEALVSMGQRQSIGRFVERYLPRLEPGVPIPPATMPWRAWLVPHLEDLVGAAGRHAGHGLLRVAHAVRGLRRCEATGAPDAVLLAELARGVDYWSRGSEVLPAPDQLVGDRSPVMWAAAVSRLPARDRVDGLLTVNLSAAARQDGFVEQVASLAPAATVPDTLDAIALEATGAYLANRDIAAFALLHGVTVSTMARELVALLDDRSANRLLGAVAAFVAAAIAGFDEALPDVAASASHPAADLLALGAADTLDDHTIKLTDAALGLAERSGSELPLRAAHRRIEETRR